MKAHAGKFRSFLALLAMVCVLCVWMGLAPGVDAGVVGSPHDFSSQAGIAPSGTCSACHIPHGAWTSSLWSRDLVDYVTKLDANGFGSYVNYVHTPTIPCYDCHDSHATGYIDDVPAVTNFNPYPPQDIAFGGDSPGGTPGYYENNPPYPPASSTYGANKSLNTADNTELKKTGGHYLKYYTVTGTFRKGDKLPCRDCHDPHAWNSDWQAFIRITADSGVPLPPGLTESQAVGSTYLRSTTRSGSRTLNNAKSRHLCARCHGYSSSSPSGSGTPVTYNDINSAYNSSSRIPRPPDNVSDGAPIPEHQYTTASNAPACVSCHKHNSVEAACNACHSYPGLDNSSGAIKQMSRGHWPHVGRPGAGGTANSMGYACETCHFGYDHNGSNNFTLASWWTYVNVQFNPALNPSNANGPSYAGQPATGTWAPGIGVADGNSSPTPSCAGLYCHGDNPAENLTWEGAAKLPKWDNTAGGGNCGDCHKAGSTFRQGNHAVHLDNTGANARGPGGIAAFSPAGNCSDGTATGCHTAYGKTPTTTHARGTTTFRTSPASGVATDNANTQVCNACHSTYAVAYFDNTLIQNTGKTGVQLAKENWTDNAYRLWCLTCHNNNGQSAGATANALMGGTGAWAPGIEKYWRASGHGYPSGAPVDNGSTTTVSGNVNQVLPLLCSKCHDVNARHFGNTTATGNAWRLVSWSNYSDASGGLDKFCALQCHGGSDAGTSWTCAKPTPPMDHFWIDGNDAVCPRDPHKEGTDTHPTFQDVESPGTIVPNEMAANYMPLESNIRNVSSTNFLCVTCHDPHGTGSDAAGTWLRSFAGSNPTALDNLNMLRYEQKSALCLKCHG